MEGREGEKERERQTETKKSKSVRLKRSVTLNRDVTSKALERKTRNRSTKINRKVNQI